MDANFLLSLLTSAYPEATSVNHLPPPLPNNPPHPVGCSVDGDQEPAEQLPLCEWCSEPSEDLVEVEDNDPSVGYRATWQMCPACRYKLRIQRANRY